MSFSAVILSKRKRGFDRKSVVERLRDAVELVAAMYKDSGRVKKHVKEARSYFTRLIKGDDTVNLYVGHATVIAEGKPAPALS
nr:hypothetical protein [Tanacetum cinerariifolium]